MAACEGSHFFRYAACGIFTQIAANYLSQNLHRASDMRFIDSYPRAI